MVRENAVGVHQLDSQLEGGGVLARGTSVPADGTAGYRPGYLFLDTDGSDGQVLYVNEGTVTSCDFNAVPTVGANVTFAGTNTFSGTNTFTTQPNLVEEGTAASRGPSPLVWDDCNVLDLILNPTNGFVYFNDFVDGGYVLANNQTTTHLNAGVTGFTAATAGTTISQLVDEPTGVLALNSTTDNEDSGICILGGLNSAGQIIFNTSTTEQIWFEARIKALNVTDSKFGIFCGFAEEGLNATTALIANTDALTDKDLVGFFKVSADGDKMDTVHNTAGGGGVTTLQADAVTLAADTYTKIGMHFDGTTATFYQDGVALATTVAKSATNFPDGQEMAFYFVAMNTGGDTHEACIDWVRIAAEF